MSKIYYIPQQIHRAEITIANSRFIGTAGFSETAEQARAFISTVRQEMNDATHNVYAFRAGYGNSIIEGMSDDGEPSGTSGPPTLAVLRGFDIGDVVVVITRYFGGTLLGTGGLVRAYSECARSVLSTLPLERKIERKTVGIEMPYPLYQSIKRLIEQFEGINLKEIFEANVMLTGEFPVDVIPSLITEIVEISSGSVEPLILD